MVEIVLRVVGHALPQFTPVEIFSDIERGYDSLAPGIQRRVQFIADTRYRMFIGGDKRYLFLFERLEDIGVPFLGLMDQRVEFDLSVCRRNDIEMSFFRFFRILC